MRGIKEPISNTSIIEKRIRKELEAKYGPILDEVTVKAVKMRELEALRKVQATIERARLKLLRMKDMMRLRQEVRREYTKRLKDCSEKHLKSEDPRIDSEEKAEVVFTEVYY